MPHTKHVSHASMCGLFARSSHHSEIKNDFQTLLQSAVNATPESYQQEDKTRLIAIEILKYQPNFLFKQGIVTDHFGRRIKASPYQLFLGTGDIWALKEVHKSIIPLIENGEDLAQAQIKAQFPKYQQGYDPKNGEAVLYDDRNIKQVAKVKAQLKKIIKIISADPCTNGQATLPETQEAVAVLRQLFKPNNGTIKTGLHFPLAIFDAIYKVYSDHTKSWRGDRLSFYTLEVLGAAEAALSSVDGQWCKQGLACFDLTANPEGLVNFDLTESLDRRDGLLSPQPKNIPHQFAPLNDKLGRTMVVDPSTGYIGVAKDGSVFEYTRGDYGVRKTSFELRWILSKPMLQSLINYKSREILDIYNFNDRFLQKPIRLSTN